MKTPASEHMKSASMSVLLTFVMVISSLAGCTAIVDDSNSNDEVFAVFNYTPSTNIRAGDIIAFDGSSSTPSNGVTYRWDFDGDGSIDETGRSPIWHYDLAGEKTIQLTVSDGSKSHSSSKTLTIVEATAQPPDAIIAQYADDEDCSNEDLDEDKYIVLWICEMDKSMTDRSITATTTVTLDASDSTAGDSSQYITEWNWDLDSSTDKDNDGDSTNDVDFSGEVVDWSNVVPGEYEVNLNLLNSAGMTDSALIKVYVNYAGQWSDFEIGGNTSGNAQTLDFDMNIVYDKDQGNTIRKAVGELTYPQIDDDCSTLPGATNCRAKLDIYAINEEDEEASNTTGKALDQRTEGDCDEDNNDCVHLPLSSYMFTDTESTYGDGEWVFQIRNEKVNDLQVESFIIRLHYR